MFLFGTDPDVNEFEQKGQNLINVFDKLAASVESAIDANQVIKTMTGMDNEAKKLQRTISGGLTIGAEAFREKIFRVYNESVKFGATWQSVIDYTSDLNTEMGKMVLPIESAAVDAMALGHNLGMAEKETGKMVGTFTKFTMSQRTSAAEMSKIAKTAREMGLDAKALLSTMSTSLTKLNAYNFKGGIDGLTKMNAEAQRLGVTAEKLGTFGLAEKLVDPEKAIEMAANIGMIGGSVQEMTNVFGLMNDATNNVDKLQSNLVKMAKSHFAIDELTGSISTNAMEQQKMRAEAEALQIDFEEYAKAGRAAAKEEAVINQLRKEGFELSQFSEEQQSLIKSLAEIGPGGKIDLNLPNFSTDDLANSVKNNPEQIKTALKEYQDAANMSDRQIAEKGLNTQEELQRDVRIIRDTYIRSISAEDRTSIVSKIDSGIDILSEANKKIAKDATGFVKTVIDKVPTIVDDAKQSAEDANTYGNRKRRGEKALEQTNREFVFDSATGSYKVKTVPDAVIPENSSGLVKFGKNEIFNFIKEDQAIVAPDAIKNVNILKDVYMQFMGIQKSIPSEVKLAGPKEISLPTNNLSREVNNTTKTETQSTQNINITITVDGKNVSNLTNIDPSVYKDIDKKIKDAIQNVNFWDKSKTRIAGKR